MDEGGGGSPFEGAEPDGPFVELSTEDGGALELGVGGPC